MMTFERVENYRPVLRECFAADEALLRRWHIVAGKGLNACVDKTFRDLQVAGVTFYKVVAEDELVGYFAKENFYDKEFLTGFFIMPDLRNDEVKLRFWSLLKSQFEVPFHCGLYEKNLPANKFIKSRGGREVERVHLKDGNAVHYIIGA